MSNLEPPKRKGFMYCACRGDYFLMRSPNSSDISTACSTQTEFFQRWNGSFIANTAGGYFCLSGPIQLTKVSQQTWRGEETLGRILPPGAPSRSLRLNGTLCESEFVGVWKGLGAEGETRPGPVLNWKGFAVSPQKVDSYECSRKPGPGLWTLARYEHTRRAGKHTEGETQRDAWVFFNCYCCGCCWVRGQSQSPTQGRVCTVIERQILIQMTATCHLHKQNICFGCSF